MQLINFDYKTQGDKKIILYGSENMQELVEICLKEHNIDVAYKASYIKKNNRSISIEEMKTICQQNQEFIIILAAYGNVKQELQRLEDEGVQEIYSSRLLLENVCIDVKKIKKSVLHAYEDRDLVYEFEDAFQFPERIMVSNLDAMVTEKCSLKCKNCSNLMPYFKNPRNYDVDDLVDNIKRLLEKIDVLLELRILGGEVFINPDFVKLIEAFERDNKVKRIVVFSNATIFPKEEVLFWLKKNKVRLDFSDYGDLSRNLEKWETWCEENKVPYRVYSMDWWYDMGQLQRYSYSTEKLEEVYSTCECRNLPTLIGDKLFACEYGANVYTLGAMRDEEARKEYIEITESTTGQEIDRFLHERNFLEACRYCGGKTSKNPLVKPFIQVKESLEYEILSGKEQKFCDENYSKKKMLSNNDMVSIVIPMYNTGKYIGRCLQSIMNSSYQNLEVIVVDDGSTDDSESICREYCAVDSRIHYYKRPHQGVLSARVYGTDIANGIYLIYIDADDYIKPDYIENLISNMDEKCDVVSAGMTYWGVDKYIDDYLMDKKGISNRALLEGFPQGVYENEKLRFLWKYMFINPIYSISLTIVGQLLRTELAKRIIKKIDADITYGEDLLNWQLYLLASQKVVAIENYGYVYCIKDNVKKYDGIRVLESFCRSRRILEKEIQYEKETLFEFVNYELSAFLKQSLFSLGMNTYYYPYYGRLGGGKVVIYGAGNVGKSYYNDARRDPYCNLVGWVDKNAKILRERDFLPVSDIEILGELEFDWIIVAVYDKFTYQGIKSELSEKGIPEEKILWNITT